MGQQQEFSLSQLTLLILKGQQTILDFVFVTGKRHDCFLVSSTCGTISHLFLISKLVFGQHWTLSLVTTDLLTWKLYLTDELMSQFANGARFIPDGKFNAVEFVSLCELAHDHCHKNERNLLQNVSLLSVQWKRGSFPSEIKWNEQSNFHRDNRAGQIRWDYVGVPQALFGPPMLIHPTGCVGTKGGFGDAILRRKVEWTKLLLKWCQRNCKIIFSTKQKLLL